MRGRWWSLVLVVVLGLLAGSVALALPASAAPAACDRAGELPDQPPDAGGTQDALIAAANQLARDGQLDAADRLYDLALHRSPSDARAAMGLVYDRSRRLLAEAVVAEAQRLNTIRREDGDASPRQDRARRARVEQCLANAVFLDAGNEAARTDPSDAPGQTAADSAADRWDAFFTAWVQPAGRAALPALAVLAVLLVAARLITPITAPVDARAWPAWVRRIGWWLGLALLVIATLRTTALLTSSAPGTGDGVWRLPVLAVVLAATFAIVYLARRSQDLERLRVRFLLERFGGRPVWAQRAAHVVVLGAVVVVGLLVVPAAVGGVAFLLASWGDVRVAPEAWEWLVVVAVALLGLVLHAAGRGHSLRLQVQVKGDAPDPAATAYVLGRLQDLGSSAPRGLMTPQQVDVTDLPSAALSSLPTGKVASALTSALGLLMPSVPWRATVEDAESGQLVVTLTRNGLVADTAVVDPSLFRDALPDGAAEANGPTGGNGATPDAKSGEPTGDRSRVLTAAAAVILTRLAARHAPLRAGLCGATQWNSVAAHVVATRPPDSADDDALRARLRSFAVQRDPFNALARTAYIMEMDRDAVAGEPAKGSARRLARLIQEIDGQCDDEVPALRYGYDALRLRVRHSLAATLLNICVEERERRYAVDGTSGADARDAYVDFVRLLDQEPKDIAVGPFVRDLRGVAMSLYDGLHRLGIAGSVARPDAGWAAPGAPVSLRVHYDRACTHALRRTSDEAELALDELEIAAGDGPLREWARSDPAFETFRRGTGGISKAHWERFWRIVGQQQPSPRFTELPPFAPRGDELRDLGIADAPDVVAATRRRLQRVLLARRFAVLERVVDQWRELALLAHPRGDRARWLAVDELEFLLALGIASGADLRARVMDLRARDALKEAMRKEANGRGRRGPTDQEFKDLIS